MKAAAHLVLHEHEVLLLSGDLRGQLIRDVLQRMLHLFRQLLHLLHILLHLLVHVLHDGVCAWAEGLDAVMRCRGGDQSCFQSIARQDVYFVLQDLHDGQYCAQSRCQWLRAMPKLLHSLTVLLEVPPAGRLARHDQEGVHRTIYLHLHLTWAAVL